MIPLEQIEPRLYGVLVNLVLSDKTIRQAIKYQSEKLVIRVTAQTYKYRNGKRGTKGDNRETVLVTVGTPNYAERQFIKQCKAAGEPFPVKKIQLKFVKGTN